MKKIILLLTFLSCCPAHASDGASAQQMMALSKFAGACGILQAQAAFQEGTKMSGGDEFIKRFWSTEAARLGITPDQYISECNNYIKSYTKLWDGLNEVKN